MRNDKDALNDAVTSYTLATVADLLGNVDKLQEALQAARDYYRKTGRDTTAPRDTSEAILDLADAVDTARLLTIKASRILGEGSAQFSRMVATR